jgi:hypothetical protein
MLDILIDRELQKQKKAFQKKAGSNIFVYSRQHRTPPYLGWIRTHLHQNLVIVHPCRRSIFLGAFSPIR